MAVPPAQDIELLLVDRRQRVVVERGGSVQALQPDLALDT
jgi:hypothetical protein